MRFHTFHINYGTYKRTNAFNKIKTTTQSNKKYEMWGEKGYGERKI